tara:strand:- start:1435 stop:2040 length:606 start_codon:yes stop_codon:yes gene_type:complete
MKKILALVLARKNSFRLKDKNKLVLNNKPMFFWSIDQAQKIREICDILVSTDDVKIFNYAKKLNCLVPWLRPNKISKDKTTSAVSAIHALNWYEKKIKKVDGLLLLQPTSPFRKRKTILKSIKLFYNKDCKSIITIVKKKKNFKPNGGIYIIKPSLLRKEKKFLIKDTTYLNIKDNLENLDIDTYKDYLIAKKNEKKLKVA